ncbi:MAG: hypothetical protein ACM3MI_03755, partial [Clostridiales bacterium]
MKIRFAYISLLITLSLLNIACEEDFNPKTAIRNDLYIANCTISTYGGVYSSPSVKLVLSRPYDVNGFVAQKPDSSMCINGAEVIFTYANKEYVLVDSVQVRDKLDDGTYRYYYKKLHYYYSPKMLTSKSEYGRDNCKIVVKMPDGHILSSETTTPLVLQIESNRTFNHGITTNVNSFYWGTSLTFSWGEDIFPDHLFFPKFSINATNLKTGKSFDVEIPVKYVSKNGQSIPLYPNANNGPSVSYEYSAIDLAMKSIASSASDPSDIRIDGAAFKITDYDRNLASYYSSTNGYLDSYSIRLDENTYSNIIGGLGIFGSYKVNSRNFSVDKDYVHSFGY